MYLKPLGHLSKQKRILDLLTGKKLRTLFLRKEGDSNPRNPNGFNGFRDRPIRPLSHLSKSNKSKNLFSETGRVRTANLRLRRPTLYPVEPQSQKNQP